MKEEMDVWWRERRAMVDRQLRRRGISDPNILQAMERVPRHCFLPGQDPPRAYDDRPWPIGQGQTISQPYIVAYMTEALQVQPGLKVLEIGTGCGYQTAILAHLGVEVWTVEIVPELARGAKDRLEDLELTGDLHFRRGDGKAGIPEGAPFDRLICAAAVPEIPPTWRDQLRPGGIMVLPLGQGQPGASQVLVCLQKSETDSGQWEETRLLPVAFVPLTGC